MATVLTLVHVAMLAYVFGCVLIPVLAGGSDDESVVTNASALTVGLIATAIGVAAQVCKLCGHKSDETSPLEDALDTDEWSGLRPWLHYRPHPEREGFKVPRGKICKICFHVFFQGFFADKYGSIAQYWTGVTGHLEKHAPFLKSLKVFIAKHNDDPQKFSMKKRDDLDGKETVEEIDNQGMKEKVPLQFIEIGPWRQMHPGKEPPKISKQFCVESGKEEDGVWVRKNKEGVHDFELYSDSSVVKRILVED